jgi:hypothetical protein
VRVGLLNNTAGRITLFWAAAPSTSSAAIRVAQPARASVAAMIAWVLSEPFAFADPGLSAEGRRNLRPTGIAERGRHPDMHIHSISPDRPKGSDEAQHRSARHISRSPHHTRRPVRGPLRRFSEQAPRSDDLESPGRISTIVVNNQCDIEFFRILTSSLEATRQIADDPYFECVGHVFHVAYTKILAALASTFDEGFQFLPNSDSERSSVRWRSSLSNRAFSMAMTAWLAKLLINSICLSVKVRAPGNLVHDGRNVAERAVACRTSVPPALVGCRR